MLADRRRWRRRRRRWQATRSQKEMRGGAKGILCETKKNIPEEYEKKGSTFQVDGILYETKTGRDLTEVKIE